MCYVTNGTVILVLLVGLALLTWAASGVVETTAREWFERDINSRAQLALTGASRSLQQSWDSPEELEGELLAIARDQRVLAVDACGTDFGIRSSTPGFPEDFNCAEVGPRIRAVALASSRAPESLPEWHTVATLPTGRVLVTAMSVFSGEQELGFVMMVQDLSYLQAREDKARTFLIVIFAILAILAFGVPLLAARNARHDWSLELRRMLRRGGKQPREFQPILSDLRELVDRMSSEQQEIPGQWTAASLKQTLNRHLHGEKVVILANREPYIHQRGADGQIEIQHPASGLVTALEPVMRACSGVWVAHGSGTADRETVDKDDHVNGAASIITPLSRSPPMASWWPSGVAFPPRPAPGISDYGAGPD